MRILLDTELFGDGITDKNTLDIYLEAKKQLLVLFKNINKAIENSGAVIVISVIPKKIGVYIINSPSTKFKKMVETEMKDFDLLKVIKNVSTHHHN